MTDLPDIQNSRNHKEIYIDKVGIKNIKMPFMIRQKIGGYQSTVGYFSLYVDLSPDKKGTHMSRFIVELQKYLNSPIDYRTLINLGKHLCKELESNKSFITAEFDYFLMKEAPITKILGTVNYKCGFNLAYEQPNNISFDVIVNAPVTSLCPCSKEISEIGAHNQRSNVRVVAQVDISKPFLWFEDIIAIIESSASCDIYSILKRPDEKYVTETAYNNPVFCEDIVRNVADKLRHFSNIKSYEIMSENYESIHNHIAQAQIVNPLCTECT